MMIGMELQLGIKGLGFDLNSSCYDMYEPLDIINTEMCTTNNSKRSFDDAFEERAKTVPLLNWNNKQPHDDDDDDDDDDPKDLNINSSFGSNKRRINEDGVVGWPPIKIFRKKLISYQHHGGGGDGGGGVRNNYQAEAVAANGNYMYVKVKMEGVAITRKIDITLYNSFETLTYTLRSMFSLWHEDSNNNNNYKLTYQDREGDWIIAQDVPWRTFIRTVQRLKLTKRAKPLIHC